MHGIKKKMTKFDKIYKKILLDIMKVKEEKNERTGHYTKAIPGVSFSIDIEKDGFPILTLRKQKIKSPIAEQLWFLSGSNRPDNFLQDYTKIWNDFIEEDGTLYAAYGYRWRYHFGKDQLESLISLLQNDSTSRHGVVITWDAKDDGYGGRPKKNIPCPYTFTVNIINGRLNLHNIVRSNDMMLGCPFDVTGFALLQCILAQKLKVKVGIYTHSISNAHIYDIHYKQAKELINRNSKHKKIKLKLPANSYDRAKVQDKDLVEEILLEFKKQYFPLEKLDGLNIVL